MKPLIIQYTNLLHRHGGPDSSRVKKFRAQHSGDTVFIRRADVLDYVWRLKKT